MRELYYLADFTDEVMPCAPTLEAWQEWLSNPDGSFNLNEPPAIGTIYEGWLMKLTGHLKFTKDENGVWVPEREPQGDFFAIVDSTDDWAWGVDAILSGCGSMADEVDSYHQDFADASETVAWVIEGTTTNGDLIFTYNGKGTELTVAERNVQ